MCISFASLVLTAKAEKLECWDRKLTVCQRIVADVVAGRESVDEEQSSIGCRLVRQLMLARFEDLLNRDCKTDEHEEHAKET